MMSDPPLVGLSVVVTRAQSGASALEAPLTELGASVVAIPALEIVDPVDGGAGLRVALMAINQYDWLVATSPNGAKRVVATRPDLAGVSIAAIGAKTAEVFAEAGYEVDLVPQSFVAEGLLAEFPRCESGGSILLARAEIARAVLPEGFRTLGWHVDEVVAYRSQTPTAADATLVAAATRADVVTFTSASTVSRYIELVGALLPIDAVCIGPITGAAARAAGFSATDAEIHTIDGLVDALVARFRR